MHLDISIGGIKNYFPVLLRELLQHMKRRSGATGDGAGWGGSTRDAKAIGEMRQKLDIQAVEIISWG